MSLRACRECGKEISTEASACPHCGAASKTRTGCLGWIAMIAIAFILIGVLSSLRVGDMGGPPPSQDVAAVLHRSAMDNLKLERFTWSKGGFKNVMIANFTLRNTGKMTIKDVQITCTSFGPSGTQIDTNRQTIYQSFPPGASRRIADFNMGFQHQQASSASCVVSDLSLI